MRLTRVYCRQPLPAEGEFALSAETAAHLLKVMRLKEGQQFVAFDGSGVEVLAVLHLPDRRKGATGTIVSRSYPEVEMRRQLILYLAVVKGERFDWAVEKATELGVYRLVPLLTEYTNVRPAGRERTERWQRLAESASAQSGRVRVPEVAVPLTMEEALASCGGQQGAIFVPLAPEGVRLSEDDGPYHLFIGPEGGFSAAEEEMAARAGLMRVGLGRRILRVETAALVAICLFGQRGN